MNRNNLGLFWGGMLIVAGILFMLQELGMVPVSWDTGWQLVWGVAFGLAGLIFVWQYLVDHEREWWAIIPGLTLMAIGALVFLSAFGVAGENSAWLGSLFLGAISLSFWMVYFTHREYWWAIIPGSVLLTLTIVTLIATWYQGEALGAIFFFGLAATFALLELLPTPLRGMTWTLVPAGVFALLGMVVLSEVGSAFNYIGASALILVGLYIMFRPHSGGKLTRHS